mmetsp:Transcript_78264/g.169199  ORF Transcript_78264/g.169199 Transcript_78264/m.169199 type:complete len:304 (+) Transcript_78264:1142-2053(+)
MQRLHLPERRAGRACRGALQELGGRQAGRTPSRLALLRLGGRRDRPGQPAERAARQEVPLPLWQAPSLGGARDPELRAARGQDRRGPAKNLSTPRRRRHSGADGRVPALPEPRHGPRRHDEQLLRPLLLLRAVGLQRGVAKPLREALRSQRGLHHGGPSRRPLERRGPDGPLRGAALRLHLHGLQRSRVLRPRVAARARGRGAAAGAAGAGRRAAPPHPRPRPAARQREVPRHRLRAAAEVRRDHHGAERPRRDRGRPREPTLHGGGAARQGGARPGRDPPRHARHRHGHRDLPAHRGREPLL